MFLSDSQKKVLKRALRRTMQEWRSAKAAAKQWGEPEPSIYDVRIPELTPKKAQIFLRHGLIEHRGYDPSHDRRAATSAFGRSYRSERVLGEPRFFWSREGLVTVKRLLEDRKSRSNPMSYKIEVRKNGQRYGEFGPYKRKSDADADAKELRRLGSGVRVSVVQGKPVDLSYLESVPISDQTPFERSLMGMLRAEDYSRYGWKEDRRGGGKGYTRQDAAIALGYAMAGGGDFWDLVKYYRRQYDGDIYGDAEGIVAERIGRMIRAGVISARAEDGGYGMMIDAIRSNPLTGYERTKAMLKRAAKLIDEGSLAQADSLIRESGASRVDLSNILGSKRMKKMARFARSSRSNPGHQWIQGVQEEIEEDGTAGRFTAQARRAGYDSPTAFAEKIMHEWRAGRERVWNKREKRWQKVTTMTMRRANYLLNTRQRRNG